jgi:hypothetical protein
MAKDSQASQKKKSVDSSRKNAATIQEAIAAKAAEWSGDPAILDALPANVKAQLLMKFLPKAPEVDQDLEAGILSLTDLLKDLPDATELTRQLAVLRCEVIKMKTKVQLWSSAHAKWQRAVISVTDEERPAAVESWLNGIIDEIIDCHPQMLAKKILRLDRERYTEVLTKLLERK